MDKLYNCYVLTTVSGFNIRVTRAGTKEDRDWAMVHKHGWAKAGAIRARNRRVARDLIESGALHQLGGL